METVEKSYEMKTSDGSSTPSRKGSVMLKRLFSTDSTVSASKYAYELYPPANYQYSLCGPEFLLKLLQILLAIIGAGLYSKGHLAMPKSESDMPSLMFPNVVFSAFILITSVIALSFALGQVMPETLIRVFNAIGAILYFVSACVTFRSWYGHSRYLERHDLMISARMLLAQVFVCFVNCIAYGVDLSLSVRKALKGV